MSCVICNILVPSTTPQTVSINKLSIYVVYSEAFLTGSYLSEHILEPLHIVEPL